MRFMRFFRLPRVAARAADASTDGLDAFQSEKAASLHREPAKTPKTRPRPGRLVVVLAALAIIEAVPAALWVYGAFKTSSFLQPANAAAASAPTEPAPVRLEASSAPLATPPASEEPAPAAVRKPSLRETPGNVTGTSGPATPVAPGAVGGLISVAAPVAMRIYSRGRIVGTTEAETVMLPVGTHELTFVSDETGYKARRTVKVQAGRTTSVELDPPSASVHVNATPWAEVWIDNKRIGDTPIGNLQVPIGRREFVFRHPELGERRTTTLVTLKETIRISMDMRAK